MTNIISSLNFNSVLQNTHSVGKSTNPLGLFTNRFWLVRESATEPHQEILRTPLDTASSAGQLNLRDFSNIRALLRIILSIPETCQISISKLSKNSHWHTLNGSVAQISQCRAEYSCGIPQTPEQPLTSRGYTGKVRFFSFLAAVGKVYAAGEWRRWGKGKKKNVIKRREESKWGKRSAG